MCKGRGLFVLEKSGWNVTGNINQESMVTEEDLCYHSSSNIVLFTDTFIDWEECMFFCGKLPNTRSPSVATDNELLDLMKELERYEGQNYWIPVTDSRSEGQWVDFYTSYPVDIKGVAAGELSGGRAKNCGGYSKGWGGWMDWECKTARSYEMLCPCESSGQMFLTMRGLCPDSNIDKYFVPQNKDFVGQTMFHGLLKTIIEYHGTDRLWHLKVVGVSPKTVATSDASKHSFLLGRSEWTVTGDNVCLTPLFLNSQDAKFTCHDGQCVKMEERCDQIMHCRDKSDEKDCSLLVLNEGYNRKVAPFIYDKNRKEVDAVKVDVSTSILNIIDISEVNNIIELKFDILMEWYEYRVDRLSQPQDSQISQHAL